MKHPFLSLTIVSLLAAPALHAAPGPQAGQRTPSASAQASKPTSAAQARSAKIKTHVVNADFVAYDAKARKMTIKDEKGKTSTVPLDRAAIREVDQLHLKSGDHVILTFRDTAKGKHHAVTDIKLANPRA